MGVQQYESFQVRASHHQQKNIMAASENSTFPPRRESISLIFLILCFFWDDGSIDFRQCL